MYTNCLLLGLDPAVIGVGASNGIPRVGLFRHSNPKLGEQLLYFILSSLRGPLQSAKVTFRFISLFNFVSTVVFRFQFRPICCFRLFLDLGRISIRFGLSLIPRNRGTSGRYNFRSRCFFLYRARQFWYKGNSNFDFNFTFRINLRY